MALDLSALTTKLLTKLGNAAYVSITRETGGSLNPVTGVNTPGVITVLPVVGAVTAIDTRLIDGTRIKATDKRLVLDNGVTPEYDDIIGFGGEQYTIVDIDEANHAGTTQAWHLIVRG